MKKVHYTSIQKTINALTLLNIFVTEIICYYEVSDVIVSNKNIIFTLNF